MNAQSGKYQSLELLLVEDSVADVLLTRKCLEEAELPHRLHVCRDGVEAIRFLRREDEFANVPRPDLVLLDLNMPRMGGFDVLSIVKADPELRRIPIVILSTSDSRDDINRAYELHANSYLTKPMSFEHFVNDVARGIKDYWCRIVKLPTGT